MLLICTEYSRKMSMIIMFAMHHILTAGFVNVMDYMTATVIFLYIVLISAMAIISVKIYLCNILICSIKFEVNDVCFVFIGSISVLVVCNGCCCFCFVSGKYVCIMCIVIFLYYEYGHI